MIERNNNIIIDGEEWRLELLRVLRDVLESDPMAAIIRINIMLDELEGEGASIRTLESVYFPYG